MKKQAPDLRRRAPHPKDRTAALKAQYLQYYADVPVQKYAALAIGRDEDSVIRWRREDREFADAVKRAKAAWIRKKVLATKAEFALERLEYEIFGSKSSNLGLTVNLPAPLIYIPKELPYDAVQNSR